MRTIPSAAQARINNETGEEPVVVVEVDWTPTYTQRYADKDHQNADGKLIEISEFSNTAKIGQGGQTVAMSILVDDTDETIKDLLIEIDPHKLPVRVYQSFEGLSTGNRILLFDGEINSPISWDDGTHTFSFQVVNAVENREVGFSPESGEFEYVAPTAIGRAWPICFGDVVRVPAVKITEQLRGTSLTRAGLITEEELDLLGTKVQAYARMLAELGITDNILNIEDVEVIILTEEYSNLLVEVSRAYIEWSQYAEDLLSQNPNITEDLDDYIKHAVDIEIIEFQISKIGEFVDNVNEKISLINDQLEDLLRALETEEGRAPFQDDDIIGAINDEIVALEYQQAALVFLSTNLISSSTTLGLTLITLGSEIYFLKQNITTFNIGNIEIDSNEPFPDGDASIVVNRARFEGVIVDNTFGITDHAVPTDNSITIAERPEDNDNPNEFWINDTGKSLVNKYCLIRSTDEDFTIRKRVVFVTQQLSDRCFYDPVVWEPGEPLPDGRQPYNLKLFDEGDIILETAAFLPKRWLDLPYIDPDDESWVKGTHALPSSDWGIEIGDTIYYGTNTQEIYIANLYPSTEVVEVMGYRTVEGQRKLVPIPSDYFTINLSYSIAGYTTTAIIFKRPLSDYEGENWEHDNVYVSLASTLSSNTATAIQWIIETWTDFTIDSTTFTNVATDLTNFPSHFALLDKWDAMQLIESIAWQARCAVWITNGEAKIKYLSKIPDADFDLNDSQIYPGSYKLTYTDTEDLVTVLTAEWRRDYASEQPNKIIYRNNVPLYGTRPATYQFFIYNIEELVQRSATFWLIRKSNTWHRVSFKGFLPTLPIEIFDTVELELEDNRITNSSLKVVVEAANYNSDGFSIDFEAWTPVRAGESSPYVFAWMSSASDSEEYPTDMDPYAGGG